MAGYFIAQYVINDPDLYREYQVGTRPTIQAHAPEVLVFDVDSTILDGEPPGPQTVVMRFESTEAAKAWYYSEEYQAVVGKRIAATTGFAIISESMNVG